MSQIVSQAKGHTFATDPSTWVEIARTAKTNRIYIRNTGVSGDGASANTLKILWGAAGGIADVSAMVPAILTVGQSVEYDFSADIVLFLYNATTNASVNITEWESKVDKSFYGI